MNSLTALTPPKVACGLPTNPTLSLVVPAFNEQECIVEALQKMDLAACKIVDSYEVIVVDDGSTDCTYELACGLCSVMPLRVIRFSRNFGKEQALMAGLQAANGQAVVTLDADGQEPLSALPVMFDHWRNGYKMAYAVLAHRRGETVIKQILTKAFYNALNFGTDVAIPADARDFRLMDRRVVDAITSLTERNRFMKGLYGWVGFTSIAVPVQLRARQTGQSKFGIRGLSRLALTGMTSFTAWPLRMWTGIGTAVALLSVGYGVFLAGRTFLLGTDLPGWSTLAVGMLFLGGVQLVSIGVLGEYIARIFTEVKGRPGYIIDCEHSSETARR